MTDFVKHSLHFQWKDVLVLGCQEYAGDSDQVEVQGTQNLRVILEVPVHHADSHEEGEIITVEITEDLNHPVNHSGPQLVVHCGMSCQTVPNFNLSFELSQIFVDVQSQISSDILVLPLDICCGIAREITQ